jgi:hypothetical protein
MKREEMHSFKEELEKIRKDLGPLEWSYSVSECKLEQAERQFRTRIDQIRK